MGPAYVAATVPLSDGYSPPPVPTKQVCSLPSQNASAGHFLGVSCQLPLHSVSAVSPRCAISPRGAGVLGCLSSAQHKSADLSSAPEVAATPTSSGSINHPASAGPLPREGEQGQAVAPLTSGGASWFPKGVPAACSRGSGNLSSASGCSQSPTSWAPLPGRRPSTRHARAWGSGCRPLDLQGGRAAPPTSGPGEDPGCPSSAARVPLMSARGPSQPAAPHLHRRPRHPTQARGFKAELQCAPRPLILRHAGGPWGDQFHLRRPAPGQALPIWSDCPAGSRGGPFIRIA
ncbi:hypothetical protein NDU88_010910 [Pleurodeles waltl]|uniref:Uncharacterized protein n=1 Tax=Pleurodeles waltl TaxID=8319 RepID=A0AAV7QVQ1_PLEWA|nr:hypothetical protein NDU88_010910 [Pleurodeles waltl]